jgi:hypothetical protein
VTLEPHALAHATDIRSSYDGLDYHLRSIWNAHDPDSEAEATRCGHALARAETEHWRRLLASASRHGADPAYFIAKLNKYDADGNRAPVGNLSRSTIC